MTSPTYEQKNRRRRRRRILRAAFWVTVLAVAAGFFLFGNNVISLASVRSFFVEVFTRPAEVDTAPLNGTSVVTGFKVGDDMLAVTDVGVMVMTKSGVASLSVQHGYADVAAASGGDRFIIFDRGGRKYSIYNKLGMQYESAADYPIIDAAISPSGSYILITSSRSYHNEVHCFNSKHDEKYTWYSSENYIYRAAISNNGRHAAVLGMTPDAVDSVKSTLLLFDIDGKSEPTKTELESNIFYLLAYKGNSVVAVGRDNTFTVGADGVIKAHFSYEGEQLVGSSVSASDYTVLVLSKYGVGRTVELVTLDKNGAERARTEAELEFTNVSADDSGITLLGAHEAAVYSKSLDLKYTREAPADGKFAFAIKKSVYVFGGSTLTVLD